jgi:hypothetical protein
MTLAEHIAALRQQDGGFTVRIDWLGADGAAFDHGKELVVADALVSARAIAFLHAGEGRPHGVSIERVFWEGDGEDDVVIIPTQRHYRLTLGIPWNEQHRRALAAASSADPRWVESELRAYFEGLERSPAEYGATTAAAPRQFQASWRARLGDDGKLRTVGALVLAPGELRYAGVRPGVHEPEIEAALRNRSPAEVFEYFVESGNGISNEWSVPFVVSAPSIEFAAARLMTRARFEGNPVVHLRELWLSAWPDTVQYAAEEAELLAASTRLPNSAETYLVRIRAVLSQAG